MVVEHEISSAFDTGLEALIVPVIVSFYYGFRQARATAPTLIGLSDVADAGLLHAIPCVLLIHIRSPHVLAATPSYLRTQWAPISRH
jgi:hypothetical protein